MLKRFGLMVGLVVVFGLAGALACDTGNGDDKNEEPGKDLTEEEGEDAVTQDGQGGGDVVEEENNVQGDVSGCSDECATVGLSECVDGGGFRVCNTGASGCLEWSADQPCPEFKLCKQETGMCEDIEPPCEDECVEADIGKTGCSDDGAWVTECQKLVDGCLMYEPVESCTAPATCVDGACSGGEANDCIEIIYCSAGCTTQQCGEACLDQASVEGQAAYAAIEQCAQAQCAAFGAKPAAMQECVVKNCGDVWTGCLGDWGTVTCFGIMQCVGGCGNDAACQVDCLASGSEKGQIAIMGVQRCLEEKCAQCGQDQNCYQTCAQTSCSAELMTCQQS